MPRPTTRFFVSFSGPSSDASSGPSSSTSARALPSWALSALVCLGVVLMASCGEEGAPQGGAGGRGASWAGLDPGALGKADGEALRPAEGKNDARRPPLRALYVTSYGDRWHDYERQQRLLRDALSRRLRVELDVVGKHPDDTRALLSAPSFAAGYDVIIYNMCLPDDLDLDMIDNAIGQTRDEGVPAVLLHCALNSFQQTSPRYPERALELRAAELDWAARRPGVEFPHWWRFTGVDTLTNDWARPLSARHAAPGHPIIRTLPDPLSVAEDELYRVLEVAEGVTPLLVAYSVESEREHPVAWTHAVGAGQVFATSLGHGLEALEGEGLQQLIAHGVALVTGRLGADGEVVSGAEGTTPTPNYQTTVRCQPSEVLHAERVEEAQAAVRRAAAEGRSLKVISVPRPNSNSPLICPEHGGLLLNVGPMRRVLALDEEALTVTVEPGVRADELSAYLHERGYAIPAMPDYTGVSVAGGVATAAHHSSLSFASGMADMVRALTLVDGRGELRRLEGAEAAAAAVHLGLLGVVVELRLAIEPQFKLRYGFEQGADEGLEGKVEGLVRAHDYARVMWFAGNARYVLDYYDRVDVSAPGRSAHTLWESSGSVFRVVGDLPYRVLNRAPLRAQCDAELLRARVWLPPIEARDSARDRPVGWSHQMLGSSCREGRCPWDSEGVHSRTQEASFPLRRLPEWMREVRALLARRRACFPILGLYLRFSKASDRWLGFNYGEDVVSVEIHVPKVADETYHERSADVYDELMQMTAARYAGRPHWGKTAAPELVGVGPGQYPRWAEFVALKDSLDPQGLFENRAWRQMTRQAPVPRFPGCALSRECVCEEDAHCGAGYRCEGGVYFEEARVCRPR